MIVPKPTKLTKLERKLHRAEVRLEKSKQATQKAKEPSMKELRESTQRLVNKYVRLRDAKLPCISCGKYKPLVAGHFWTQGAHGFLRYNLDNIHGQCISCNSWRSGNLNEYRLRLIRKIGQVGIDMLDSLAHCNRDWTREELYDIQDEMKQKIQELQQNPLLIDSVAQENTGI